MADQSKMQSVLKGSLVGAVIGFGAALFFDVAIPVALVSTAIGAVGGLVANRRRAAV